MRQHRCYAHRPHRSVWIISYEYGRPRLPRPVNDKSWPSTVARRSKVVCRHHGLLQAAGGREQESAYPYIFVVYLREAWTRAQAAHGPGPRLPTLLLGWRASTMRESASPHPSCGRLQTLLTPAGARSRRRFNESACRLPTTPFPPFSLPPACRPCPPLAPPLPAAAEPARGCPQCPSTRGGSCC